MSITQLQLWSGQQQFMEAGPQPTLFFGGVGSGKTYVGILKMLYLLDLYPGSRGALVRQRANQLRTTTAKTLFQLLPKSRYDKGRRNDNEGFVQLNNGSEIVMRRLDKENSIEDLKSLELNFAYVDQMEDISAIAFDTLVERIGRWSGAMMRGGFPADWPHRTRQGHPIPPRYVFASAYSPGYDHWITSRWWEQGEQREKYKSKGYKVVFGSTRDNLALSEEYVADRLSQGEEYVERYVDATTWGANEGQIFTVPDESIVPYDSEILARILRSCKLHRVYDHGDSAPSACIWYATDHDDNIIVYREYMQPNLTISQHRENIWKLSWLDSPNKQEAPIYHSNYADPKIFTKDRGRKEDQGPDHSVADEWMDRRIMHPATTVCWRRANNNESVTVNRVKEYLLVDPTHKNPFTGAMGAPHMYFITKCAEYPSGCRELITDVRSARRMVVGFDRDGNKLWGDKRDTDVRDHLLDTLRYGTASRPSLVRKVVNQNIPDGEISWQDYQVVMEEQEYQDRLESARNFQGQLDGY